MFPYSKSRTGELVKTDSLSKNFHKLFHRVDDTPRKKHEKNKDQRVKSKSDKENKCLRERSLDSQHKFINTIELHGNASSFTVYATVRQCVLFQRIYDISRFYHQATITANCESDEEFKGKFKHIPISLPKLLFVGWCFVPMKIAEDHFEREWMKMSANIKIVGLGLHGVFELIRETHEKYPQLCLKSLQALLDLLQGLQPESMNREPQNIIEELFAMLMDLANSIGTGSDVERNSLASLACSALISLSIALGDTGKMLVVIKMMLMSPQGLAFAATKVPKILSEFQRSVQAILVGSVQLPDWYSYGIKSGCHSGTFLLPPDLLAGLKFADRCAIANDGYHMYILNENGLVKIETGFGGTKQGRVVRHNRALKTCDARPLLLYTKEQLLCRIDNVASQVMVRVNCTSLEIEDTFSVVGYNFDQSLLFSDGESIGQLSPANEDNFVLKTFNAGMSPITLVSEMSLKLTRKCLESFGALSVSETDSANQKIVTGFDEETHTISSGKDFTLIKAVGGKVLYSGRAISLGVKQGASSMEKWAVLPISKSPKIVQVATGHESAHALMLANDGTVFFVGTAKRGEDGESTSAKSRRQPKAVAPKKMACIEEKLIINVACNSGSSAMVTREGEVYIFGKDCTHCDSASGLVTDLKDVTVTQIALGKAHIALVTNKGDLYTFGVNNKGQCGHDFTPTSIKEVASNVNMTEEEDKCKTGDIVCTSGSHCWCHDLCLVCTLCGECTGYGASCINSRPDLQRHGLPCGCGYGDSGCSKCGLCRLCAGEKMLSSDPEYQGMLPLSRQDNAVNNIPQFCSKDSAQHIGDWKRSKEINKISGTTVVRQLKAAIQNDEVSTEKSGKKKSKKSRRDDDDTKAELARAMSLPPQKVVVGHGDVPVLQVACGMHHTVVLLSNGKVYTFGNNSYGQLGLGDNIARAFLTSLSLPEAASQVAAGSQHTVILLMSGRVYTCGSFQKNSLGRSAPEEFLSKGKTGAWNCIPGAMHGVGPEYGRRATWVGASGDETFLKIDELLISAQSLQQSIIFANKSFIGLIPKGETAVGAVKCLMIGRKDGSCKSFVGEDQMDMSDQLVCLDPVYNVLWGYSPVTAEIHSYNIISCMACNLSNIDPGYPNMMSPELTVPVQHGCMATRFSSALHMLANLSLGCLDALAIAQQIKMEVKEDEDHPLQSSECSKDDYAVVNRFERHGGGWGYSDHSVEAVRFMCDTDILLCGFGLYGGRGEYFCRVKVYALGVDGGDIECDCELLVETDEVLYACGAREKFSLLFNEPLSITAHCWYVAWARISGPSSDCGSSGLSSVCTEDQVAFQFKSSKKSNNGTDVLSGQIPQLLYRIPPLCYMDTGASKNDNSDPAYVLSRDFSFTVTEQCFDALLDLLTWSWSHGQSVLEMGSVDVCPNIDTLSFIRHMVYISRACLRLLRIYIGSLYPDNVNVKCKVESCPLPHGIDNSRQLLCRIMLNTKLSTKHDAGCGRGSLVEHCTEMQEEILSECHNTFCACFHAFYPTGQEKYRCFINLLLQIDPASAGVTGTGGLLASVMEALCHPAIKLTAIMPINYEQETSSVLSRQSAQSMDDNFGSAPVLSDNQQFAVSQPGVSSCMQPNSIEAVLTPNMSFKEVLNQLLVLVASPIRQKLSGGDDYCSGSHLVTNACHFLAAIIGELAATSVGMEVRIDSCARPMLVTPNRFMRVMQNAAWNTGDGNADAVSFSVDRSGVVVAGICVYGGGGTYEYEIELLEETRGVAGAHQGHMLPSNRWTSLQVAKGAFGPDDMVNLIAELMFRKPIPVKEGYRYAVKLVNVGQPSFNGDGGVSKVKCSDGTTFVFSTCPLSVNGTNHLRGQIPQLLYYSAPVDGEKSAQVRSLVELQAGKNAIDITGAISRTATDLMYHSSNLPVDKVVEVLAKSDLFSSLLPLSLAFVGPAAVQDPRGVVQVLCMVEEILPAVVNITQQIIPHPMSNPVHDDTTLSDLIHPTTSLHYVTVECDHPYKPASVTKYNLRFHKSVQWMVVEFDSQCATAQPEDYLQMYIPVLQPVTTETGSHCDRFDEVVQMAAEVGTGFAPVLDKFYGCDNWPRQSLLLPGCQVVFSLETASDYLKTDKSSLFGFKCTVTGYEWNNKPDDSLLLLEKELSYLGGMCSASLLQRDLLLPFANTDSLLLKEAGAQAAFEAYPQLLENGFALSHFPSIIQALEGNLPFCWQSNERAFLKDFVFCADGTSGGRLARWLQPNSYADPKRCEVVCSAKELKQNCPTEITVLLRDQHSQIVHAPNIKVNVKAMPVDHSEIIGHDFQKTLHAGHSDDRCVAFGGILTPRLDVPYEVTFRYRKEVFHAITMMKAYENFSFEELRFAAPLVCRPNENVMLRDNMDGSLTGNWTPRCAGHYAIHMSIDGYEAGEPLIVKVREAPHGFTHLDAKPETHFTEKMRKFVAKSSAGLRIRSHPTLQSEQIGMVKPGGIVSFVDKLRNGDGVWLRLSMDSVCEWCEGIGVGTSGDIAGLPEAWCLQYNLHFGRILLVPVEDTRSLVDETHQTCLSHNMLQNDCYVDGSIVHHRQINAGGDEAFHGSVDSSGIFTSSSAISSCTANDIHPAFIQSSISVSGGQNVFTELGDVGSHGKQHHHDYSNLARHGQRRIFGSFNSLSTEICKGVCESVSCHTVDYDHHKDVLQTVQGVSVKELVKVIGENRANGNGPTPKHSPPGSPNISLHSSPKAADSPRSISAAVLKISQQGLLTTSDIGIMVSRGDIQIAPPHNPSGTAMYENHSCRATFTGQSTMSSESTNLEIVDVEGDERVGDDASSTSLIYSGNMSPKLSNKHKDTQLSSKEEQFPLASTGDAPHLFHSVSASASNDYKAAGFCCQSVKLAMSPSVAECLRAVFAAFMWHEGIVHDAMACASCLKFRPKLGKDLSQTVMGRKPERVRQRHATDISEEFRQSKAFLNLNEGRVHVHFQQFDLQVENNSSENCLPGSNSQQQDISLDNHKLEDYPSVICGVSTPEVDPVKSIGRRSVDDVLLPQTLKYLIFIWEDVTLSALKAINEDLVPNTLTPDLVKRAEKLEKLLQKRVGHNRGSHICCGAVFMDNMSNTLSNLRQNFHTGKTVVPAEDAAMMTLSTGGEETSCELCGGAFPSPVTYHMRQSHPGCRKNASGNGYNSSGIFMSGWHGICGDGGIGGCSWYLLCAECRERYLKHMRRTNKKREKAEKVKKVFNGTHRCPLVGPNEVHKVMRENAMFLLDLSVNSGLILHNNCPKKRQSLHSMEGTLLSADVSSLPSVSEYFSTGLDQFPPNPFQFLSLLNAQSSDSAFADDVLIDDDERVFLRATSANMPAQPFRRRHCLLMEPSHAPLARSGSLGHDIRPLSNVFTNNEIESFAMHKELGVKSAGTSPEYDQEIHNRPFYRSVPSCCAVNEALPSEANLLRAASVSTMTKTRHRNISDGGESLLKHPSAAMVRLINSRHQSETEGAVLQRPVMLFIAQRHDLDGLQVAMRQWLRKVACRVFALQAFNWLLRTVVQPCCLHDILWFFVVALLSSTYEQDGSVNVDVEKDAAEKDKLDKEDVPLCDHPLSDICVAGKAVGLLSDTFHAFLQSISDLMMFLPVGSPIQISFTVCTVKDVTNDVELKASSHQAMIGSLTDFSTATFWESGDEDHNRVKTLTVTCSETAKPSSLYIHVDNTRDVANKVASVSVSAGCGRDLTKLNMMEVDGRFAGWLSCAIPPLSNQHILLELRGPDLSLRVRQIRVLGTLNDDSGLLEVRRTPSQLQQQDCESEALKVFRILTSQVFEKLHFTHDNSHNKGDDVEIGNADSDLKEHMVSILFSQNKLSHLQKQVCAHIVDGIHKETLRLREEWESCSGQASFGDVRDKSTDGYCFELLSLVEALSGSLVGRRYLAQQFNLIHDLFSLLHTASPRIQRQIVSILRRVLPDVKPTTLAGLLLVPSLPMSVPNIMRVSSSEGHVNVPFDPMQPFILDMLLGCIAKALTVQVKKKDGDDRKRQATVSLDNVMSKPDAGRAWVFSNHNSGGGDRALWWMKGLMPAALATSIIALFHDMLDDRFSQQWATVTNAAIAEAVLNLTKLDASHQNPEVCINLPTLWLALASLCVLRKDHVDSLSSGHWVSDPDSAHGNPKPTCDNHDDNSTSAIILCAECGSLCADCDRFLHLSRRMRSHQRQVFKEEAEAIRVDLHEGCGRVKLFWVMAVADSKTLKAMVEFKVGKPNSTIATGTCRFCGNSVDTSTMLTGVVVCADVDCQAYAKSACIKTLDCGHPCGGILDEDPCLPCLLRCRPVDRDMLKQDADDMCMICFTEALSAAPAILLACGHVFHLHCSQSVLQSRWIGPRITFGFRLCPICKSRVEHKVLKYLLEPVHELYEDVRRKALMRLEYEGLHRSDAISRRGGRFFEDPAAFAMERYAYYVCSKCSTAYYGGEARCEDRVGGDVYNPEELVCGRCSDVSQAQVCSKHGSDFLEYKCRYCCSVAIFFCFGTTHFCNQCHDNFPSITHIPKANLPRCPAGPGCYQLNEDECPLYVNHPATGEEFALGCGVCRYAHTF